MSRKLVAIYYYTPFPEKVKRNSVKKTHFPGSGQRKDGPAAARTEVGDMRFFDGSADFWPPPLYGCRIAGSMRFFDGSAAGFERGSGGMASVPFGLRRRPAGASIPVP